MEIIKKNGEPLPVEIHGRILFDEKGRSVGLQGTTRDISERKKMEDALRASEELYRTVVESTTDAIVVLNTDRNIVSCNQGFADLFGYGADEVKGQSVQLIYESEEAFRNFGKAIYESLEKTGAFRGEVYFRKKSGECFPAETVTSPIRKNDLVTGYVGIVRDISERKRVEKELRESEAFIKSVMDNLPIGIAVNSVNSAVEFLYMNDNFAGFYRIKREAITAPDAFWDAYTRTRSSGKKSRGG